MLSIISGVCETATGKDSSEEIAMKPDKIVTNSGPKPIIDETQSKKKRPVSKFVLHLQLTNSRRTGVDVSKIHLGMHSFNRLTIRRRAEASV